MDGPEEATLESAWPEKALWPRKRGHSRVFAAVLRSFAIRFFGESRTGTLLLPTPINSPAEQQRRAYSELQSKNLGFLG